MNPATNDEQIHNWNFLAGPRWALRQETLDAELDSFGREAIAALGHLEGRHVLDVGCGCGATSLQLAASVGPSGHVTGIDVSSVMLDRARQRAAHLSNVSFVEADAQAGPLAHGAFDAVFSRFGVMFFADPVAAFRNFRAALKPGCRLAFVCWQSLADNPWMSVPLDAVLSVGLPVPAYASSECPGPFAFASPGHVRWVLESAGLVEIEVKGGGGEVYVGGEPDLDAAVEASLQMGPAAMALRDAAPDVAAAARIAVRAALAPYHGGEGVRLPARTWIVTAMSNGAGAHPPLDGSGSLINSLPPHEAQDT